MTFNELTEWYVGLEKVKALKSYWRVRVSLDKFNSEFGNSIVGKIKPLDLENYQAKRISEGKAAATIDQEVGAARTMIIKAFNNDLVGGDKGFCLEIHSYTIKRSTALLVVMNNGKNSGPDVMLIF